MEIAKIGLSAEEAALIEMSDWILTKNRILIKVKILLEAIQEAQVAFLLQSPNLCYPEIRSRHPKISKGENYRGLPYLVLDHPRYFKEEDALAIRTMFWWGNFFSVTLHISGRIKLKLQEKLLNSFNSLGEMGFYLCIHETPWEYHFDSDNYVSIDQLTNNQFRELILNRNFSKITGRTPIHEWETAGEKSMEFFRQLIRLLED